MSTPEDPKNSQHKARSKALPGGGTLSLVRAPEPHDHFLKAMDLRRGSVNNTMDEDAAVELFRIAAADEAHLGASAALALLCEGKVAIEEREHHFDKSNQWILKGAESSDEWGLLFLGIMYFDGRRVEQNYEEAAHYFKLAAGKGNSCAQGFLGYMYSVGHGVLLNRQSAVAFYRAAADQGHVVAQFDLGV